MGKKYRCEGWRISGIMDISTIKCKYGGTVSIDDAGQKEIGIAEDKKNGV